jgi:30S ribosomal protein S31
LREFGFYEFYTCGITIFSKLSHATIKLISMGKGDQKSRRGKLFRGSYGVRRPRKGKVFSVVSSAGTTAGTSASQDKPTAGTVREDSRTTRESQAGEKPVQSGSEKKKKSETTGKAPENKKESPGGGKEAVK